MLTSLQRAAPHAAGSATDGPAQATADRVAHRSGAGAAASRDRRHGASGVAPGHSGAMPPEMTGEMMGGMAPSQGEEPCPGCRCRGT